MKPARVLFVQPKAETAGSDHSLLTLLEALDRPRFEPLVVVPRVGPLHERIAACSSKVFLLDGVALRAPADGADALRLARTSLRASASLRSLMREHRVDLVHANSLVVPGALLAARLEGVPAICHAREIFASRPRTGSVLARLAARLSARVIAISQAVLEGLPARARPRARVVYNAVDLARFTPRPESNGRQGPLRRALQLEEGSPLVGFVGRLFAWKGPEDFLVAAREIAAAAPRSAFVVVGGPVVPSQREYAEGLRRMASDLGIASRCHFAGERADLAEALRDLDLLLVPSRDPEPLGRTAIEAMACGLPVVASATGGLREVVEEGATGFLVPPRNPGALASAALRILGDRDLARRMGSRARAVAEARFWSTAHARAVEGIYEEVLTEGRMELADDVRDRG